MRSCPGFLRAFPWIPDPVKDRSGMTEEIDHDYDYDYDYRFAEHEYKHKQEHKHEHEHEHEHENAIRHACDLSFEAGFFGALAKKNGKERRQASRVLFKNIVGFQT
jgi:hypothetical protein